MSATAIESTTPETAAETASVTASVDAPLDALAPGDVPAYASEDVRETRPALAEIARSFADRPEEWLYRVRLSADGRWYERLYRDDEHEIWLISWLPGQATGFHDHGESRGAFAVALGTLEEHSPTAPARLSGPMATEARPARSGSARAETGTAEVELRRPAARTVRAGESSAFGTDHVHDVRNASDAPAVSVHVYSPPLSTMNRYELTEGGLVALVTERAEDW
jgi:predicted metal-dependent enzyme (double-stranded beta helix superfamily)